MFKNEISRRVVVPILSSFLQNCVAYKSVTLQNEDSIPQGPQMGA